MKKFLAKAFLFLTVIFLIVFISLFLIGKIVNKGNYFTFHKTNQNIILGHSHAECSYNDSLILGFKNLAQSGESYFYTYFKLKKVLENNTQIKTCFVEFTNNNIESKFEKWIWDDQYISNRYPKYFAFMNASDIFLLAKLNTFAILNAQSASLKSNFLFIKSKKKNYIIENNLGGYLHIDKTVSDSCLRIQNKFIEKIDTINIANINLQYLTKIVDLCNNKKVKLFFIRSPTHKNCTGMYNERQYKNVLKKSFSNVEFLDFKNFILPNLNYVDYEHFNYKGASKYSKFFNSLVEDGLLIRRNKQQMIDSALAISNL